MSSPFLSHDGLTLDEVLDLMAGDESPDHTVGVRKKQVSRLKAGQRPSICLSPSSLLRRDFLLSGKRMPSKTKQLVLKMEALEAKREKVKPLRRSPVKTRSRSARSTRSTKTSTRRSSSKGSRKKTVRRRSRQRR